MSDMNPRAICLMWGLSYGMAGAIALHNAEAILTLAVLAGIYALYAALAG